MYVRWGLIRPTRRSGGPVYATERFEMRLGEADKRLMDRLRGKRSKAAFMLSLLRAEGKRQQAVGTGPRGVEPGSSEDD